MAKFSLSKASLTLSKTRLIQAVVFWVFFLWILSGCTRNIDAPSSSIATAINDSLLNDLILLIKESNPQYPDMQVKIDKTKTNSPGLIVTGFTNTVERTSWTLNINQNNTVITEPTHIKITPSQAISPENFTQILSIATPTTSHEIEINISIKGSPISEWFTPESFTTYFESISFAGQNNPASVLNFDGQKISNLNSFYNTANGRFDFSTELPPGYELRNNLVDPDGSNLDAIPQPTNAGTITIYESTSSETYTNSKTYTVTIALRPFISPVIRNHIQVTDFNNNLLPASSIRVTGTNIIISELYNIPNTDDTNSGTIRIAPPPFTYENLNISYPNPEGVEATTTHIDVDIEIFILGTSIPHRITFNFLEAHPLILTFESPHLAPDSKTITSHGETLIVTNDCEFFIPTSVLVEVNRDTNYAFTPTLPVYFNERKHTTNREGNYILPTEIDVQDASGNPVITNFLINVQFPPCDEDSILEIGAGTPANPYLIDKGPKLYYLADLIKMHPFARERSYKLTTDIDMGITPWSEAANPLDYGFNPIGESSYTKDSKIVAFKGSFDCSGHTISNLYVRTKTGVESRNDRLPAGLFGYIRGERRSPVTIKNCRLENVTIIGDHNVGGLVGAGDAISNSVSISNISVTGTISQHPPNYGKTHNYTNISNAGGLIGYMQGGIVTKAYANVHIATSNGTNIGGLIGHGKFTTIANVYAKGNVSGTSNIGGLIGNLIATGTNDSYSNFYTTGAVTGTSEIGGLIGGGIVASGRIEHAYWDTETSGLSRTSGGGTGRTTSQMQVAGPVLSGNDRVYINWSRGIWRFTNGEYPQLISIPER
ncbi:hypothetical protein COTS27_00979 [Spirochaetota bacterium]|nr:hypothetical protein COTS27_00979 [Spirochaetota bacterium]